MPRTRIFLAKNAKDAKKIFKGLYGPPSFILSQVLSQNQKQFITGRHKATKERFELGFAILRVFMTSCENGFDLDSLQQSEAELR